MLLLVSYEHIGNFPIIKVQAFVRLMMNPISHHLCVYHLIDPNGFIRILLGIPNVRRL